MSAHYFCISRSPRKVTDSAPLLPQTNLNSSHEICLPSNKPYISFSAVFCIYVMYILRYEAVNKFIMRITDQQHTWWGTTDTNIISMKTVIYSAVCTLYECTLISKASYIVHLNWTRTLTKMSSIEDSGSFTKDTEGTEFM